ncbi:MAG: hypothetical protein KKA61_01710 [Nanoarchaeota archaeon]|nr:hypothetical protein [Nanoarchaeota archaeon]MBU3942142.1 hypothetical protein [Nanoarchaeota archaeon]MBU4493062.1 hypothetical protein [Nanoarchaeota archaeon]
MQHEEQKEEIKNQPTTKEEDRKRILKIIFGTVFVVIIASYLLYLRIVAKSIKELVLIIVASIIVIIYLTRQKRFELSKWGKEWVRRGLKIRWILWLGLFLAFLSFLFYKVYPENDLWVFAVIPAILLLATYMYRPPFLFKSE